MFVGKLPFVEKKNVTQAPTADISQISVIAIFELNSVLEKVYREDVLINSVFKDLLQALPNFPKESYHCICKNYILSEKLNDKLKTMLENEIAASSEILTIEISFKGLTDIPTSITYDNLDYILKPYSDPFEIAIFSKKKCKLFLQSL